MSRIVTDTQSLKDKTSSVLLVTPWYRPVIGGVTEIADTLLGTLNTAGIHTYLLVCAGGVSRFTLTQDPQSASVWRYDIPAGPGLAVTLKRRVYGWASQGLTLLLLARFILRLGIKTVVLIYPIDYAWPFPFLARVLSLKIILSFHGSDVRRFNEYSQPLRRLIKTLLSCAHAITVPIDSLGAAVREIVPDNLPMVVTIKNAVDVTRFAPPSPTHSRQQRGLCIVHVSNFSPIKRTIDIVEAFSYATLPSDSYLVMVGEGPDKKAAQEMVSRMGIADRVVFTGGLADIRPILWEADLFVIASEEETGPLATLEAMACGIPWISTNCGLVTGWPEGEFGLLVPNRSTQLLARAMEELLVKDPCRRIEMGKRGRLWVEKEYSHERYVGQHLTLILE